MQSDVRTGWASNSRIAFFRICATFLLAPLLALAPGCSKKSSSPAPEARKITLKGQVAKQMAVKGAAVKYLEAGEPAKVLVLRTLGNYDVADIAADGTFAVQTDVQPCGLVFIDVNEDVVGTLFLAGNLGVLPLQTVDETTSEIDLAAITIDPYGEGTASHDPTLPGGETELTETERAVMRQHAALFVCCMNNLDMDGDGLVDVLHGQRYRPTFRMSFTWEGSANDQPQTVWLPPCSAALLHEDYSDLPASGPFSLMMPGRTSAESMGSCGAETVCVISTSNERIGVPMPGTYQIIAADRTITLTDFPLLDPDFFIVPSDIQMLYDPDDQSGDQAVGVSWRWVSRGGEEIDASKLVAESYVTVRPSSDRIVVATCKTEPTCSAYWLGAQGGYITCRDIFGNIFETGFGSVPRGSSCHVGTSVAPLGCGDVFPADGLGNLSGDDWLNEPCIWTPFFVRPAANQYFSCWTGALTSVREYDRKILLHDSETTAHFVPWNGWEALGDSDRGGGVSRYGPRGNSVEGGSRCPSLALTSDGRPVVAWISDICDWIIPVHQNTDVYCRVWDGTQWTGFGSSDQQGGLTQYPAFVQSMGPPYPTYPQSTAICLDSQDRPIVAWTKTGAGEGEVFVARWDGSIWTGLGCTLGGPGISGISWNPVGGLTLVLKMNPSGNPVLATPSQVLTWNGSSWDTMSLSTHDDFTLDGSGNPVVAWGDDPVYVAYWDGSSWAGLGCSLAYPAGGVMAGEKPTLCAAPDGKIALACWDDSINDIRVAIWNGSTWDSPGGSEATSIFGALSPVQKPDSSELSAPQGMRIALSTDGAPIVAWIDDFSFISSGTAGGDQGNGVLHIAQWNGVKWAEIGPGSASGRGLGNVSGCGVKEAALAVGEDGLPVVAWTEYSFYRYFEGPDPCPMRQVFLKRFRSGYTNPVEDGPPSAFLYAPNVTADETFGNAYSGLVPMIWTVTDIGGDAASIAAEYSTDDGATWLPATLYESTAGSAAGNSITGIPALPAPRGRWWLYWESDTDGVGMAASASVRFRITPSDEEGAGTPSVTSLFTIDNSGFQATFSANPVAAFGKTYPAGSRWNPSVVGGIVEIPISVIDEPLRQKCSVTFDYSDDGGSTWKPMTITESQNGVLIPPNTVETLTPSRGLYPVPSAPVSNSTIIKWDSISDGIGLSTPCQNVSIRLTPSSEDGRTGNACCHNGLTVDNFTPPQIAVATPTEGSGNTTVIEFSYTDHRSSTITLEFQYSTDGTTWCDASSLSSTVYLLFGDPASCPVMDPPFPWPTAGSYGTCYIVSGNQVSTAIRDYQWPYVRVTWDNGAQLGTAFVGNVKVRLRGIDPLLGAGPWAETAFFGVDNTQ